VSKSRARLSRKEFLAPSTYHPPADELPKSIYKFRWYLLHFSWGFGQFLLRLLQKSFSDSSAGCIEGFLITPLVHREAITTPPVLIISVQVLLFALIGFLGVLLAIPIVACMMWCWCRWFMWKYSGRQKRQINRPCSKIAPRISRQTYHNG
jgi:hypothetical protein